MARQPRRKEKDDLFTWLSRSMEQIASAMASSTDMVEVPNLAEHQCLELAHLQAFTASSLKDAARRAGFHVEWVRSHGSFRSPILRLYVTLLARAVDKQTVRPYLPFAAARTRMSRRIGIVKREFFTRHYPDWTWQSPEKALEQRTGAGRNV